MRLRVRKTRRRLSKGSKGGFLVSEKAALASKASFGGFLPSIMGPFMENAAMLTPLAVAAGYRLVRNTKTLRKMRGKTRSKANLRPRR